MIPLVVIFRSQRIEGREFWLYNNSSNSIALTRLSVAPHGSGCPLNMPFRTKQISVYVTAKVDLSYQDLMLTAKANGG
jgi:hypothetical protein